MAETDLYSTMINNPQLPQNPNKFYTHFLYKAVFVSIFLLLLPLFPPDFINHTINTRSWELLQLVFVGIAVSYGLFSKRNDDETQKEEEQQHGSINVQSSYVARLLQVSSVFDEDDSENPSNSSSSSSSKVQTWNSQYYRGEPIVVVAKETSQQAATVEKPLLLTVRSLKNGVSEVDSFGRSNSRRLSRNMSKLSSEENIVLRSQIPWRSRSGRMEIKEDFTQTQDSPPRYQPSKPISDSPFLSEIQLQDVGRVIFLTNSSSAAAAAAPTEDLHNRGRRGAEFTVTTPSDTPLAAKSKSFGTGQQTEFDEYLLHDDEIESFIERRGSQSKKFMTDDTQTFMEYPKEFMEADKHVEESEDDEDEEGDDELQELASKHTGEMVGTDNGPDVDKKADEFIAKFREQIRLQRIASIRRSTAQTPKIGGR